MRKTLAVIFSILTVLAVLVVWASPMFAHQAPANADANDLQVSISRPAIVYHVGDVIHYSVTVNIPLTEPTNPPGLPAGQSDIAVSFDPVSDQTNSDGTADDTPLTTIAGEFSNGRPTDALLPGESVVFTATGATYHKYHEGDGSVGNPTRAQLLLGETGGAPMPANPTYDTDTTTYAGSYPILDHTIAVGDPLTFENGIWQETALAHIVNNWVHDSADFHDSNDKLGTITTGVSIPNTITTISANATAVDSGQSVTLTVTENNTGDVDLTSPHVVVLKNGAAFMDLVAPPTSGDIHLPTGTLNGSSDIGAELWTWVIDSGPLTATTIFQATGHGIDDSQSDVTFDSGYTTERQSVTVNVNSPGTIVGVSASSNANNLPPSGGNVDLTFTEHNSGTIALSNVKVTVLKDGAPFTVLQAPPTSGDPVSPGTQGILDPGETWSWTVSSVLITATTTFTATGDGTYGTNPVIHVTTPSDPDFPLEQSILRITVPPPQQTPASSDLSLGLLIAGFAGVMLFFGYRRVRRSQS